jgi:hypothetical protein
LAFFENPLRFRGLLALAEEDEVASQLRDEELRNAAGLIATSSGPQELVSCYPGPGKHCQGLFLARSRPPVSYGLSQQRA